MGVKRGAEIGRGVRNLANNYKTGVKIGVICLFYMSNTTYS